MRMSSFIHMPLTTSSSLHMPILSHSPSTPTPPMLSSLLIHTLPTPNTHSTCSTHKPHHNTRIHSNHSTSTLSTHNTHSILSILSHFLNTNSIHAPHSHSTPTNSTPSTCRSTHMDILHHSILTPSTHMALPHRDHTPSILTLSILSTLSIPNIHTTPSLLVTHHPTIVEGQPEDPHMLVTVPLQTRMTRKEFGHS
ncbi:hypothetical protein CRENBAI_013087 [Crenichthys baileyi]|uniref:Uncharacterized protein n=1 Tax=Crenichthys baileyi TaxID=28760 RepID=A0AAV9RU66_9TELE